MDHRELYDPYQLPRAMDNPRLQWERERKRQLAYEKREQRKRAILAKQRIKVEAAKARKLPSWVFPVGMSRTTYHPGRP